MQCHCNDDIILELFVASGEPRWNVFLLCATRLSWTKPGPEVGIECRGCGPPLGCICLLPRSCFLVGRGCVAAAHLEKEVEMEACCLVSKGQLGPGGCQKHSKGGEILQSTRVTAWSIHRYTQTLFPSRFQQVPSVYFIHASFLFAKLFLLS